MKDLGKKGYADILAAVLKMKQLVKAVHVLKDAKNTVLRPRIDGAGGGKVSQMLSVMNGDAGQIPPQYFDF